MAHSGVETELRTALTSRVETGLAYSSLHRESKSEPPVALLDTPNHKVTASVVATPWSGPRGQMVTLAGIVSRESSRNGQNDAGTIRRIDGFTRVDVKASWRLHRFVTVEAGASNAFDTRYQLSEGFPQPGRTVFGGVRFSLQ